MFIPQHIKDKFSNSTEQDTVIDSKIEIKGTNSVNKRVKLAPDVVNYLNNQKIIDSYNKRKNKAKRG